MMRGFPIDRGRGGGGRDALLVLTIITTTITIGTKIVKNSPTSIPTTPPIIVIIGTAPAPLEISDCVDAGLKGFLFVENEVRTGGVGLKRFPSVENEVVTGGVGCDITGQVREPVNSHCDNNYQNYNV